MKRSKPSLRTETEIKAATTDRYGDYIKRPSRVNPIFTRKPYTIWEEEGKVKNIDTLEIISRMSKKGNKELKLAPLSNIKSIQTGQGGWGEARIALPNDLIANYSIDPNSYIGGLLICKRSEYEKEKELLISEVEE